MAVISTQTRKVTDLPQTYQVNNSDNIMIHDGRGLKKVSVQTFKNGVSPTPATATAGSNGVVRPDNSTITIDGSGVLRVNRSALNIPSLPSEIVAHKLINQNGNQQMKYWFGSRSQYESISYKDPNTIYDVYE
ncbi:hypothetical protein [uncultured Streptococcus sp.]|uniref:phage upper tail fiber protein n=1 Tax=uncultured Streptococcus sp. TaxID=83427 RepID=UPI0028D40696|nr:hypothetical protein [uncultured Streptococcus sp.]